MNRAGRIGLYVLAGALFAAPIVAAFAGFFEPRGERAADFSLTDTHGQPFKLSDQKGSAVVLFFGYTNCPDVCPATLGAIASAYRKLGEPANLKVAFVTVDPKRDSRAALQRYVALFNRNFVGLTGDPADLAAVYKAYGVYAKIDPDASSALGYTVTHTAAVYLIDKRGKLAERLDWSASAPQFAAAFRKVAS